MNGFDAIVLDVDGTLYLQGPVRRAMLLRLAGAGLVRPLSTWRAARVIRAFRASLEELRASAGGTGSDPDRQLQRTAERTGLRPSEITAVVEEWMFRRPLDLVGSYPTPGLHRFLALALRAGAALGVFSEYPCEGKLRALGVHEAFAATVSSYDPDVGRFKPDPTGFLVAAGRLGVAPERTLVIGDRDDADGAGARAAGMRFVEIGTPPFPSFVPLCEHLFAEGSASR